MSPAQRAAWEAAALAAFRSAYITAFSIFCGLCVAAYTDGHANSLDDLLTYFAHHWLSWSIANIIAPLWRASAAYQKTKEITS